jgi:hypothetical protein
MTREDPWCLRTRRSSPGPAQTVVAAAATTRSSCGQVQPTGCRRTGATGAPAEMDTGNDPYLLATTARTRSSSLVTTIYRTVAWPLRHLARATIAGANQALYQERRVQRLSNQPFRLILNVTGSGNLTSEHQSARQNATLAGSLGLPVRRFRSSAERVVQCSQERRPWASFACDPHVR